MPYLLELSSSYHIALFVHLISLKLWFPRFQPEYEGIFGICHYVLLACRFLYNLRLSMMPFSKVVH